MGLFDGMLGNATRIDPREATQEYGRLLGEGEQIHAAYLLIRDAILFTDRRLILVDKQGITGKKTEYHSVPYARISHFSVETAGTLDMESELKVAVSGGAVFTRTFGRGVDIGDVQKVLASYVLA